MTNKQGDKAIDPQQHAKIEQLIGDFALKASQMHQPGKAKASVEASQLIELLHKIQREYGYLPQWSIASIAGACNITRADVWGVVSFYDDFVVADNPPSNLPRVKICRAEACQAMGSESLFQQTSEQISDKASISSIYCLGNCALAPSAMVDGQIIASATTKAIDAELKNPKKSNDPLLAVPSDTAAKLAIYVGLDTSSIAAGCADLLGVLQQLAKKTSARLVTTGGRGLYHLEPLIEIEENNQRHAFARVTKEDVSNLIEAGSINIKHPSYSGLIDSLDELKCQTRFTFARAGVIHPLDFTAWKHKGGMQGLDKAFLLSADKLIEEVANSQLRGRGGAGFPTGIKWRTVALTQADQKYVVCNADEGDSGTFADRLIIESDPFTLFEGMAIAGYAVGASMGYIYLRSEYPLAAERIEAALDIARSSGLLGDYSNGFAFDIELRMGAGAYICGEETSLLESLEGKRGTIRYKPPLPAIEGAFGKPTALNNVITLASIPAILAQGAEAYASLGVNKSRGTLTVQLAGNIKRGGLYEVPFGITLGELVETIGGGCATGKPVRAVQVGGPLGAYFPVSLFDTALDYEAFAALGGLIGHGGIVVFDESVDLAYQAEYAMRFCAHESCGKCTPCRIGSTRGAELIAQMRKNGYNDKQQILITDLCDLMEQTSLCALGGMTPYPVRSALQHFASDFNRCDTTGERI